MMPEKLEMLEFWQDMCTNFNPIKNTEDELIKLSSARYLLFDSIVQKEPTEKIFDCLNLYKKVGHMIHVYRHLDLHKVSGESRELFEEFGKLEAELYNLKDVEDMTYIPGGYAGLYLAVNMRNKPTMFLTKQVDEELLEELINIDIHRGTPASHAFVVAALNYHLDLLSSAFWNKFYIDWSYSIGQYNVFMAPNEFIRRILHKNPYSKEDTYSLVHKIDDTLCFLMDRMLKTVSQEKACEIISMPNHLGFTTVFFSTRLYYRTTSMLLHRFPQLRFNQICNFGNTVGLLFTPLIGRILERGMNPFIKPRYAAPVESFNFDLKDAMFEKYPELKNVKLPKEKYLLSSQYSLLESYVREQADIQTLEKKWVTGYDADGEPLTSFYSSWYDIDGPEESQRIKSMRYFPGKLIKKENLLGKGGQGSVYKCLWHGKPAAAKFIKSKDVDVKKYFMTKGAKGENELKKFFTKQASEFYIGREIKNANVLNMYDFFLQHENGVTEFVIVSELCEKTLLQEDFSMAAYIRYFSQVNAAIKAMGEQGLCHRDIKPENILLKRESNGVLSVRVADFGLTGFSGGTPLYNPPESMIKSVPFASDIYSLGITMLVTLFETELAFKLFLMPDVGQEVKKKLGNQSILAFISKMIADDYKLRPNVDDIDHFLNTTRLWKLSSSDARINADDLGISEDFHEISKSPIGSDIQRRAAKFENNPFSRLHFSDTFTRVTNFEGITQLSKMISQTIHDQGDSFKCWAFATASMIRSSLREAISKTNRIVESEKEELYEAIKSINHKLLRSELMMNVIPTKVNANSEEIQSAMLHHVMRRLTEPTYLQREGIFMLGSLKPILDKLKPFNVKLQMFAHPTDYDRFPTNLSKMGVVGDFVQALGDKKVLVCPVKMGESSIKHAMCLFGFNEKSEFMFKNTSNETKTIAIRLTNCEPRIGYHICFEETAE